MFQNPDIPSRVSKRNRARAGRELNRAKYFRNILFI